MADPKPSDYGRIDIPHYYGGEAPSLSASVYKALQEIVNRINEISFNSPAPTIDAILDKISAQGIDRLTDEERRILDDHSRRLRDG